MTSLDDIIMKHVALILWPAS